MNRPQRVMQLSRLGSIDHAGPSAERERPLSIILLLGSLGVGGAEHQAIAMASTLQRRGHTVTLVALSDGPLRKVAEERGLVLEILARRWSFSPAAVPTLAATMRRLSPDVVYAFLEVQWLLALAARTLAPGARVVLGLRSSQYARTVSGLRDRAVRALTRQMARHADLLIANSLSGLEDFTRHVPQSPYGIVVPNGIDTTRFEPDPEGRAALRAEWNIRSSDVLVGHVGRLDPVKDHELLIDAFARAAHADGRLRLVCVGHGTDERLASLRAQAARLDVDDRVLFVGARSDLAAVYSALDALALTSVREGFPNVVAEAMVCGVPAVVTDTGASAEIVGALGEVVPCGDPAAFATALQKLIARRSAALSARCRLRILADFTLDRCGALTSAALQTLVPSSAIRQGKIQ